jgi:site-specific DNA-methyltransferase (adenine-specific)
MKFGSPKSIDKDSKMAMAIRQRDWLHKRKGYKDYKYKGKDISFEFGSWDHFDSLKEYLEFSEKWFKECIRVLKKGGHIVTFWDKHKLTYLVDFANKLKVKNRQCLFLIKTNPVPCARKVNFMSAIELAYWGTKETTERSCSTFNFQLGQHPDYFMVPITPTPRDRKRHPCEKHPKWIEWVMKYLSKEGDIVLDPFAGAFTTAIVCEKLNRRWICIEKNKEYCEIGQFRLNKIKDQTKIQEYG